MILLKVASRLAVVLVLAAAVVWVMIYLQGGCHRKVDTTPRSAQGTPIGTAKVQPVRSVQTIATESAPGAVEPVHEAAVASKLFERVIEVNVTAGQHVKKDQVLVRLDDSTAKSRLQQATAAVASAKAAADQAQIDAKAVEQAFRIQAATQSELDRANNALKARQADLLRAESALGEARLTLEFTVILAPIDGVIIDKRVNVGDTVAQGQVLLTLYDPTRMQLVAQVRESLAQGLKVGQSIQARIESMGYVCQGQISEIVPQANIASRTFLVKVAGACQPGVYPGMFGRIVIPVGVEELTVIPVAAVRRVGQLDLVDVAENGVRRQRFVRLGRELSDSAAATMPATLPAGRYVQVLSGLRPGEQVVVGD
jgi:RND family efflux transporter MFP subunit